jgi:protein SCO1
MNKNVFTVFASIALSLALGACQPSTTEAPPLEGARMGGTFTLMNQDGVRVSDTAFAGRYRIVYFGYTFCPDVCPVDTQVLSQGLAAFEKQDAKRAARVQPIFITVDPKRDTPTVLKAFLANFHPRFIGLTGTEEEIAAVAPLYAVAFEREKPNAEGGYLVSHSNIAVLYGPTGAPIAPLRQDKGAAAVAEDLDRWVK